MISAPVFVDSAGTRSAIFWDKSQPSVLLPGAFNPLHDAHLTLAALAERIENRPAAFELSIANVDKPELTDMEVQRRLGQFLGKAPLWITRAPLFTEKAELFPGAIFAIGADTAARLMEPRYYGSGEAVEMALEHIAARSCRFLVAGRVDAVGRFLGLQDITIPARYRELFVRFLNAIFEWTYRRRNCGLLIYRFALALNDSWMHPQSDSASAKR